MQRRLIGILGVLGALSLTAGACIKDPLGDRDGAATAIITDVASLTLLQGEAATVTATVVDGRSIPIVTPITFAGCDANVTAADDPAYAPVPENTSNRAIVTAVGPAATCVEVSGGGVTETVEVIVLPTAFTGALSSTTPPGGSEITITATADLQFDPASVSVTFGGGAEGVITSATATEVKVLVPFSSAAPLSISGIAVTYVPGLSVTLPTAATVTQTGDAWTGDLTFATAPTIAIPAAVGATTYLLTNFAGANPAGNCAEIEFGFGSAGPCVIYKFVVPAGETLDVDVVADWDSGADIDIYSCDATGLGGCFEDGGGGATGAQPEDFSFAFPEGTHYLVIENYDGTATANVVVSFTRK